MKITIVSAHYPPNFVSGGTLVPERLARGLTGRGHDVDVYAGWLGEGRAPLEVWNDEGEDGVPQRWIAVTPYVAWSDRHNYDNPEVAADFADHLGWKRPEVVHLHSLQTLGAGLVHAAADLGIPVVVTMHDFWWWCARQFLCTAAGRPCSLVVDAGTCPCEVDRSWLEARNDLLAAALARVDRVVAVSEIQARVLVANGVDPARIQVMENGVPRPPAPPHAQERPTEGMPTEETPVGRGRRGVATPPVRGLRLAYVGGPNDLKGIGVLLDAARAVADLPGWTLSCYGCETRQSDVAQVRLARAYPPDRLDAVLDVTDVLVVPSLMRETYSLAAREALARGIPVVCSDSLGPEEVVRDGVDGIVVPSGDVAALAAVLRTLVADPGEVERLSGGGAVPTFPTVEAHVAATETLLASVIGPDVVGEAGLRRVGRVLFVAGIDGAPLRYRAQLPAEALASLGVAVDVCHYRHPDVAAVGARADAVVVYRVPATLSVLDTIGRWRAAGIPVVFDVDDLIFDPELADEIPAMAILPPDEAALWLDGVRRYRTTMEACDAFVGSTATLCDHATAVTGLPSFRWRNGVGRLLGRLSDDALGAGRGPGPRRVGYLSGTDTHDHDWAEIQPAMIEVLDGRPDVELWLVGPIRTSTALDRFGTRVRRLGLQPWSTLPRLLADLDVSVAPMVLPNRFNEAKSAIKWLEAALVATPTVASPTVPFAEVIDSGVNGILAEGASAWVEAVGGLLDEPALAARLGSRARRDALVDLAPAVQGRRYLAILEQVVPRAAAPSSWVPVAPDEPRAEVEVEPYEVPSPVAEASAVDAQASVGDVPGLDRGRPAEAR